MIPGEFAPDYLSEYLLGMSEAGARDKEVLLAKDGGREYPTPLPFARHLLPRPFSTMVLRETNTIILTQTLLKMRRLELREAEVWKSYIHSCSYLPPASVSLDHFDTRCKIVTNELILI